MNGVATPARPVAPRVAVEVKPAPVPAVTAPPAVAAEPTPLVEPRKPRLSPGDDAVTCEVDAKSQPWGVASAEDFAEVKEAMRLNDPAGIAAMETRRRFFRLNTGIKLKVLGRAVEGDASTADVYKVRIADGEPAIQFSRRTNYGDVLFMYSPYIATK
jgi:hypothetical protein